MDGGGFKRVVLFKFKEGVAVEEMLNGLKKLFSEIDLVKSAEWGEAADIEGSGASATAALPSPAKGFTHAVVMRFDSQEDCLAFMTHPAHVELGATFLDAVDDFLGLNFPVLSLK
ncbi:unnamed protein product [Linum trigynum]|uniref:Stress-response A/B barrel domain-containing protein n=1 Tax=Linum trigynum TaxID=586398 RepID=A0AAV2G068_9ROSI